LYHRYKIKLNKYTNELKGELVEHKTNFKTTLFENPFPNISKNKEKKSTTIIKDYLKKADLNEFVAPSNDSFFSESAPYIPNTLNSVNNKLSDCTQSLVISKILDFRKIQDMFGDGFCGYYAILSQDFSI
jgi:hypothetical protein